MKKFTAIILTLVFAANLTACSKMPSEGGSSGDPLDQPISQTDSTGSSDSSVGSDSKDSSGDPESSGSSEGADKSSDPGDSENKTRSVYGEAEIPDLPDISEGEEGRANTWEGHPEPDPEKVKQFDRCLESMVFETHTLGDYTVSLVADKVRTDSVKFPGYIFVQNPRAEIKKNGEHIGDLYHDGWMNYVAQFGTELRLHADKIGSYVDLYDLEVPVVALRYWFDDDPRRLVTKCVTFAPVTEPYNGSMGSVENGIGVQMGGDNVEFEVPYKCLAPSDGTAQTGYWAIFESDEFKVVDKNTLLDEEAGTEFTFDFREDNDPFNPKKYLYSAKWVK